ncbi:MAG: aminotransferase class III-fold pyridoxal phosphate-dependent enzyme, partial [Gemmatimonadaceae bacterium]
MQQAVRRQAYADDVPTNVQGSIRAPAAQLAEKLNALLRAATHTNDTYVVQLSSTGTEAVEAALKHALLEFSKRRSEFATKVEKVLVELEDQHPADPSIPVLRAWKHSVDHASAIFLAVQGSFHGKTAAALSATSNASFKSMFDQTPLKTLFLDPNDLAACSAIVRSTTLVAPNEALDDFSPIAGIIFEPLQCDGGMFELSAPFARWMESVRTDFGTPLIADEIQCGFFRTGRFLCSELLGLSPNYILLGKSLGGGLSKIAATCIEASRYVDEFGWVHSSTFAEDEPSCLVSLGAMEAVEALSPTIEERAAHFERRMREGVAVIQQDVGAYVAEIRGRGFLLGLDFDLAGHGVEIPL